MCKFQTDIMDKKVVFVFLAILACVIDNLFIIIETNMGESNNDDPGEALASGANDIVVVKQTDGTFQATPLQVIVGKMTNWSTMTHSREGRKAQLQVNNLLVVEDTTIEIGDSGDAFIARPERSFTFTSKELEDMKLKDGINEALFVVDELSLRIPFSIHLLNQGNRLVLTDVDGTITTSNVGGFIGGQMGFNVHHDGVIELFDKLGKNGYTLIYLSARPMAFNEETREYLFEKLQATEKGFSLPISPLFVSNVTIAQAAMEALDPSSTKTATMKAILEMFDLREHVVFGGYGNKESDAKAYGNVGIEKRKIFIVDEDSKMRNYGSGEETSYEIHAQNVDIMYPKLNPLRTGITDL